MILPTLNQLATLYRLAWRDSNTTNSFKKKKENKKDWHTLWYLTFTTKEYSLAKLESKKKKKQTRREKIMLFVGFTTRLNNLSIFASYSNYRMTYQWRTLFC